MRKLLLILPALLSGCMGGDTSAVKRSFLNRVTCGLLDKPEVHRTWFEVLNAEVGQYHTSAIWMFISGLVIWRLRLFPRSGLGVALMGGGAVLSIWGFVAPTWAGVVAVAGAIGTIIGAVYMLYCWATGRKIKRPKFEQEPTHNND